jgi:hypothetical protein
MKKDSAWLFRISLVFIALSALVYAIHILVFRDAYHTFFYLVEDVAFLFLNVLLVIVLIERLLARREKMQMLKKLNMVIGTFFSEVGLELLRRFSAHARNVDALSASLRVRPDWTHRDFKEASAAARKYSYDLAIPPEALTEVKAFLQAKRGFLVLLLENPNLLEHECFTDLLWAVFHLAEELSFREGPLGELPASDYQHLMTDAKRAYAATTSEWITYVEHLKGDYPFLFSLAARVNPFSADSSVIVR